MPTGLITTPESTTTVHITNELHRKGARLVNYGDKQLQVFGPVLWNSIPLEIRQSKSLASFKYHMKKYFIDQYSEN